MRRILTLIGLMLLIAGGVRAAAVISVAGANPLDLTVRDANRADVLTTLFNATTSATNKHALLLLDAVTGHIAQLVLIQVPFNTALTSVLGSDYRFSVEVKQGVTTYSVILRNHVFAPPAPALPSVIAAPSLTLESQDLRITTRVNNNTPQPASSPTGYPANPNGQPNPQNSTGAPSVRPRRCPITCPPPTCRERSAAMTASTRKP